MEVWGRGRRFNPEVSHPFISTHAGSCPQLPPMDRTHAALQLVAVARSTAINIHQRPSGEMTLQDTLPIEQTMAMLTPEALGLVPYAHPYITPPAPGEIRYLHIAQETEFSIGVFVFPPGTRIPLHDHPNMSVVSHVLYGSVKITSYDRIPGGATSAAAAGGGAASGSSRRSTGSWFGSGFRGGFGGPRAASAAAAAAAAHQEQHQQQQQQQQLASLRASAWHRAPHTSRLTPSMANVHEIEAGADGTAILDVLIPPYDETSGRDCTYYRPEHARMVGGGGGGGRVRLVPCLLGDEFRVVRGEFVSPFPT